MRNLKRLWVSCTLMYADWLEKELTGQASSLFKEACLNEKFETAARIQSYSGGTYFFDKAMLSAFVKERCQDIFRGEVDTMAMTSGGVGKLFWNEEPKWKRDGDFQIKFMKPIYSLKDLNWDMFSYKQRSLLDMMNDDALELMFELLCENRGEKGTPESPKDGTCPFSYINDNLIFLCEDIINKYGRFDMYPE